MLRNEGKSLTEYLLVLGLVAIVAIPATAYMGVVLENSYRKTTKKTQAEELFSLIDVNKKNNPSPNNPSTIAITTATVTTTIPATPEGPFSFYNGPIELISLGTTTTSAKGNLAELIGNSSSGGTIYALSDALEQMAKSPDLDPASVKHIKALANIGFQNAVAAKAVESAFLKGENMDTIQKLSKELGFVGYSTIDSNGNASFALEDAASRTDWVRKDVSWVPAKDHGPNGKTKELLDYYQTHVKDTISDQTTALVVHNLVDQIAHAAGTAQDLATRINSNSHPLGSQFSTLDRTDIYKQFMSTESKAFQEAAKTANSASTDICATGEGTLADGRCS